MADFLKRGATLLASKRTAIASQLVTIKRGELETANVPAGIAKGEDLRADNNGFVIPHRIRDFRIAAEDYDFGDGPTKPLKGDIILDPSSGTVVRYTVRPIAGEDAAVWADHYGVTWRIHTVRDNG